MMTLSPVKVKKGCSIGRRARNIKDFPDISCGSLPQHPGPNLFLVICQNELVSLAKPQGLNATSSS